LLGIGNEYLIFILVGGIITSVVSVLYCLIVLFPTYFVDKEFIENKESIESFKRLMPFPALFAGIISLFFISIFLGNENELKIIVIMFISNLFCMAYMGLYFFLSTLKIQQNKSTQQLNHKKSEHE